MSSETTDPRAAVMVALTSRLDAVQRITLDPPTIADGEQTPGPKTLLDIPPTMQEELIEAPGTMGAAAATEGASVPNSTVAFTAPLIEASAISEAAQNPRHRVPGPALK